MTFLPIITPILLWFLRILVTLIIFLITQNILVFFGRLCFLPSDIFGIVKKDLKTLLLKILKPSLEVL